MKKTVDTLRALKTEALILYRACRDPRVSRAVRIVILVAIAYAFSPIDLIPDFIPVLGHIDDIIILPLLILLARKMIPDSIYEEYRAKAESGQARPRSRAAAAVIILIWAALLFLAAKGLARVFPSLYSG